MPQTQLQLTTRRIAARHLMVKRLAKRQLMARRLAGRHLAVKRIATHWVEAEAAHQTKFDDTVGERKVRNPATGRDIKLKSLKRHDDPKLRQRYKDEYAKWRDTQKDDGGAEGKTKTQSKLKAFLGKIKGVSKAMAEGIKKAPEATQKFISDPTYRKEQTKAMGSALKKAGEVGAKAIWNGVKTEAKGVFVETPKILIGLSTGKWYDEDKKEWISERRKPTKKELKTLYGSAVYAGGVALTMMGGPAGAGLGKAAAAGATAFANSFTLHMAFRSMGNMVREGSEFFDEKFLGYEFAETLATGAGQAGVEGLSSLIPSSSAIYPWAALSKGLDLAKSVVLGAEEKPEPESKGDPDHDQIMEKFINQLIKSMADVLDKGISDGDMENILAENGLPASA